MPNSSFNNNSFFQGVYKDAWKQTIPSGLSEAEVDFIIEVGKLKKGDCVLDLMCGYGRHALELGRRNCIVTAVDNLQNYIEEINNAAAIEHIHVEGILEDILHLKLTQQYHAVVCMGNSFAFFTRDEAVSILKNISVNLKAGGVVIINSWMIAEIAIKYFRDKDWYYAGEYKCILDYRYCFQPSRIESEQTIISNNGNIEVIKGIDYIFTLNEIEAMFLEAGLQTSDLYSTPRKRKFSFGDSRIYIVAKKLH